MFIIIIKQHKFTFVASEDVRLLLKCPVEVCFGTLHSRLPILYRNEWFSSLVIVHIVFHMRQHMICTDELNCSQVDIFLAISKVVRYKSLLDMQKMLWMTRKVVWSAAFLLNLACLDLPTLKKFGHCQIGSIKLLKKLLVHPYL